MKTNSNENYWKTPTGYKEAALREPVFLTKGLYWVGLQFSASGTPGTVPALLSRADGTQTPVWPNAEIVMAGHDNWTSLQATQTFANMSANNNKYWITLNTQ